MENSIKEKIIDEKIRQDIQDNEIIEDISRETGKLTQEHYDQCNGCSLCEE